MAENWHKLNREEPAVIYCTWEETKAGSRYGPVIRDVYIVECCVGGKGSVTVNGKRYAVKDGDCYFLLPGDAVIHTADARDPRRGYWCAVDGLAMARYLKEAGITSENPFAPAGAFERILDWMKKMVDCQQSSHRGTALMQTACIYGVLGALLQERQAVPGADLMEKAVGYLETHYSEPFSVAELARHVGMARSYFSVLFKEKTGLAPHQYVTALRIRKACRLLENTDTLSVAQVAELVGLDQRNFARLFKRETGITPLEYKKTQKMQEMRRKQAEKTENV